MYFFSRLNPPRPSFAQDMTEEEHRLMGEHVVYWKAFAEKGIALLFGPVADPKGTFGICVTQVESEAEMQSLTANDPVVRTGNFTVEFYPMPNLIRAG